MAVIVLCLVLFLAVTGHSEASYCVCKDGLGDTVYQTNIDYACGNGADCSTIMQNGACYQPNTKKDHCNYAVNSYFQRKNQINGSCDFTGSCTVASTLASSNTNCVYPASPSTAGTIGTTPSTGTGTTPSTGTTTGTTPTTTTGGTTSTTPSSVFGLGPTGSGSITNTDSKATSVTLHQTKHLLCSLTLTLLLSGPMLFSLLK
ncbi:PLASMODESMATA CALLOSE-BINDING PROTEIN 3 [Rhododendron vialii]|uniref:PLASMODESMATA CALLOSE-BINDING PROTEIN 3 n=1 Tax=Rhododendron vialii TaxID=182163 RepID=UPI00265FA430|nr:PLASMODESMATA CALLOSE-BINDING PROTEIN 3 [Rhododendron vialii]